MEIPCSESFVPNTRMAIFENSLGIQTMYRFYPDEGYVMHVKSQDEPIPDENYETIGYREMFGSAMKSVSINYDFSVIVPDTYTYTDENGNTVNVPIERIGAEELYTLPASAVDVANTYGGVTPPTVTE